MGIQPRSTLGIGFFGDGNQGFLDFDGSATVNGVAPVANVYIMTSDFESSNVRVRSGVTLAMSGYIAMANGNFQVDSGGVVTSMSPSVINASGLTAGTGASAAGSSGSTSGSGGAGRNTLGNGTAGSGSGARDITQGTGGGAGGNADGVTLVVPGITPLIQQPLKVK